MSVRPRVTRRRVGTALLVLAAVASVLLVAVDGGRFSSAPEPTVAAPVTLQALLEDGSQERHTLYAFLRAEAPGARIVLDTPGTAPSTDSLYLHALAAVGRIDRVPVSAGPLGTAWMPTSEPDLRGRLSTGAWEVHREPGVIDTVLVGSREGRTVLVDRRSAPELDLPRWDGGTAPPQAPTLARAVTVETLLLLALVLMGGAVLPRRLGSGLSRIALALLAGAASQAFGAYLFLAGVPAMGGGVAVALGAWWWLRRRGVAAGWTRADLPLLALTTIGLAGTALAVRLQGLVVVTADAIAHVARAVAIGSGTMGLLNLNEKRPLALAAIEAPAHALGVEGLHALGWALLIAAAIVLASLPGRMMGAAGAERRGLSGSMLIASLAVLALPPLVPLLRTMAAFQNTHLLVAVLLLLLVVLWVEDDGGGGTVGVVPAGGIALLALVPSRVEAVLIVGLVLLATLAVRDDRPAWPWAWPVVGVALLIWNGLHVIAAVRAGTAPSFPVTALALVGAGTLLLGPLALRLPPRIRRGLAVTTMAALWLALLAILTSVIGSGARALLGLRVNLGEGEGAWGVLAPLIVLLVATVLVADAAHHDRRVLLARWLTVGAVPSVLLAKAADGTDRIAAGDAAGAIDAVLVLGARIGSWGDSANRMWVHFLLVAIALVVMVAGRVADDRASAGQGDREGGRVLVAGALSLLLTVVVLVGWQPSYLGPASPGSVIGLFGPDEATTVAGPELTRGVRREVTLPIPRLGLPEDAEDIAVCARLRFTDVGRIVTARTRVGLSGSTGRVEVEFDEFPWVGEWIETLCLEDLEVRQTVGSVTVWAEGAPGARAGTSAVLLVTDDDLAPVDALEVRYVAASEDPRGALQRAVSIGLRLAIRGGPALIALLLAGGLLLVDVAGGRPRGEEAAPDPVAR